MIHHKHAPRKHTDIKYVMKRAEAATNAKHTCTTKRTRTQVRAVGMLSPLMHGIFVRFIFEDVLHGRDTHRGLKLLARECMCRMHAQALISLPVRAMLGAALPYVASSRQPITNMQARAMKTQSLLPCADRTFGPTHVAFFDVLATSASHRREASRNTTMHMLRQMQNHRGLLRGVVSPAGTCIHSGDLARLRSLALAGNDLERLPSDLGSVCPELTALDLSNNRLSADVVNALLRHMDHEAMQCGGDDDDVRLRALYLGHNNLESFPRFVVAEGFARTPAALNVRGASAHSRFKLLEVLELGAPHQVSPAVLCFLNRAVNCLVESLHMGCARHTWPTADFVLFTENAMQFPIIASVDVSRRS